MRHYGKGWFFESYKHSLAAKGIRTSMVVKRPISTFVSGVRKQSETPSVFERKGISKTAMEARIIPRKRAEELIAAAPITAAGRREIALRKLEMTLQPREARGQLVYKTITKDVAPPKVGESFGEYVDRVETIIHDRIPPGTHIEWVRPVPGEPGKFSSTVGQYPVEDLIENVLARQYGYKGGKVAFYDPKTKKFSAGIGELKERGLIK